ncbi:ribosome maturation factor RimM [Desulfuromonas carbonis]|uniref:ribosome maturation factor RimM n=1 Tax=Desulfuromonas sp. DDH964 TaxID=1823759 RepID=UPI00078DCD9A|nr:ribosome maturation factor RimM [Desulfuromonas sp. DDH964]AMV73131.1 16S rRNA processing protein RimM [Desulfuromonas sp. DDH964]
MTALQTEDLFQYGTVIGTHGLRGDLKVRPLNADSTSLQEAREVTLRKADGSLQLFRVARAAMHKGLWLLRLAGLETIEAVQPLVGCDLLLAWDELPELAEDEYYWHQLQGLKVLDRQLGELGVLSELLTTAAHDIYVVTGPLGEVMIPVVSAFITEIDLESGVVRVDLPEELARINHDL